LTHNTSPSRNPTLIPTLRPSYDGPKRTKPN
jgi:hypothetical protein